MYSASIVHPQERHKMYCGYFDVSYEFLRRDRYEALDLVCEQAKGLARREAEKIDPKAPLVLKVSSMSEQTPVEPFSVRYRVCVHVEFQSYLSEPLRYWQ